MKIIILLLIIIIIILVSYLICIKKELKRIKKSLKNISKSDSNMLLHSELSLKELNALIKEINVLLKEKKEEKSEFARKNILLKKMMLNISHDLRTPLTSSLGYIDIILNSQLPKKEEKHDLKIVEERLLHLEELLNSFFEFAKMTSDKEEIVLTEVNIIAVLESSIAHYYDDFINSKRQVILKNSLAKYKVLSNKEMLSRIFDNLISNAFKHSESDLVIEVLKEDTLRVSFSNKLSALDLDIAHIFDEFYTRDISRTKGNTGLGLAIAKEFIEKLNGTIKAVKKEDILTITIEII